MSTPSIGTRLKSAREDLGITCVDAAQRLHIRAMFVDAIERDDWRAVGEAVYVRGFIRNYARLLHLDADSIVADFNDSDFAAVPAPSEPPGAVLAPASRFRYPWLLAAMSLLAFVLVIKVVWTMASPTAAGHDEVRPQSADAMSAGTALPARGGTIALSASHPLAGVDLRLSLTQSCWLSIRVDGKRVVYETLPAGTVRDFHAVREISVRAGNAGGVVATIDGQPLGTLGGPGQVQDRVFAANTASMPPTGPNAPHE